MICQMNLKDKAPEQEVIMGEKLLNRIEIDPNIMLGKPVIRGTRIPVEMILRKMSQNISVEEILADYPRLTRKDIQAVLEYAAESVSVKEIRLTVGKR